MKLLASSGSVAGIEGAIRQFWCSDAWVVDPQTLVITHPDRGTPDGVRVVKKGQRYRFERVEATA